MNFLARVFDTLNRHGDRVVLRCGDEHVPGAQLLRRVGGARAFLRERGVAKGDRVALLGPNSIQWIALDLAIMAEGAMVVPFYSRESDEEIAQKIEDCEPKLVLRAPFDEPDGDPGTVDLDDADPVRIIYTSGTSGTAKGVVLTVGNISFMVPHTAGRVERLMAGHTGTERAFHFLPFCFAGSWILLMTCLTRATELTLNTALDRLKDELPAANPHFVLNVPLLLERIRLGIEEKMKGGLVAWIWRCKPLARLLLYPAIRRKLGPELRGLICGSAALAPETQRFFIMLGIEVLQVYGLTETTAICTMDEPGQVVVGRVGRAIEGSEMKLSEQGEILVRGPHIFPGYWKREAQSEWLATGDLGEVDASGNWRILGRKKHVIVLQSGHNVGPEGIEEALHQRLPTAEQIVLVGDARPSIAALVFGKASGVQAAVDAVNETLPHYQRVRAFWQREAPLTPEEGLLTANGKLKRKAIAQTFSASIEELYA